MQKIYSTDEPSADIGSLTFINIDSKIFIGFSESALKMGFYHFYFVLK